MALPPAEPFASAPRQRRVLYAVSACLGASMASAQALHALFLEARLEARLGVHGLGTLGIGLAGFAFAFGVVAFAAGAERVLRALRSERALGLGMLLLGVTCAALPLLSAPAALIAARFFEGVFVAAALVTTETLLLSAAGPGRPGGVMGLYAIAQGAGGVIGPAIATALVGAAIGKGYVAAAATALLGAGLALGLLRAQPRTLPELPDTSVGVASPVARTSLRALWWRVKLPCASTFTFGVFQSAALLVLPLFLTRERGLPEERAVLLVACFGAGVLIATQPWGRLGDRVGHLKVLRALAGLGAMALVAVVLVRPLAGIAAAVLAVGGTLGCLSPLSLALQGAQVSPAELTRANALYNAHYAAGLLLGPLLAAAIAEGAGPAVALLSLSALFVGLFALTWLYAADDPAWRRGERSGASGEPVGG